MKLYVYENLLSERFIEKELNSENKTYEEIFRELNLEGNFLIIENDEVKQYPQCTKDIPMANAIVHIKRIPKKRRRNGELVAWRGNGVSRSSADDIYVRTGSDYRGVANGRRSKRISGESNSGHI